MSDEDYVYDEESGEWLPAEQRRPGKVWLGRQDSNLRMPVPKTGALPLGDAPT